jgi:hypothetical protein
MTKARRLSLYTHGSTLRCVGEDVLVRVYSDSCRNANGLMQRIKNNSEEKNDVATQE